VLLIDEIDKAEPNRPNDLLEPLDRRRFDLPDGFSAHRADGAQGFATVGHRHTE
jgi:MoxR-like ATPase